MSARRRTTWQEKLAEDKGLPKVADCQQRLATLT